MANRQPPVPRTSPGCGPGMAAAAIVSCFAFGLALGCSSPSGADDAGDSARERGGEVSDASLPAAERERRQLVRRLLDGIVAGEDVARVARWFPGVEFRESREAFFAGNLLLRRWDFAPATRAVGIPVILEFIPADDATAKRVERRTYEVTGSRGAWVVDRVPAERLLP